MGRKYTINVEIPDRYNWRTYYKEDLENALDIIGSKIVEGETEGIIEFDIKWNVQETETNE